MTIYDKLMNYSKEEFAQYLLRFANDTVNQFSNFQTPNYKSIMNHLNTEIPE